MRKALAITMAGVLGLGMLGGCATQEQSGALIGGLAGAALGSTVGRGSGRTAAIIAGTLAGSIIGSKVGRSMDEQDRMRTQQVLENNRTDQSSTWHNPDTGNTYTVTPVKTYTHKDEGPGQGQGPCREFTMNAKIGGKTEQTYGTACRQADGSWKIVNSQ